MSKKQILLYFGILLILSLFLSCQLAEVDEGLQLNNDEETTDGTTRSCVYVSGRWYVPYTETSGPVVYYEYYSVIYLEKLIDNIVRSSRYVKRISGSGSKYYK